MSDTVRVYEIAEEAGASSQDVIAKAKDLGIDLKSAQTAVSYEDAEEITNYILTGKSKKLKQNVTVKVEKEKVIEKELEKAVEKEEIPNIEVKKPEVKKVVISKPIQKTPVTNLEDNKTQSKEEDNKIIPKRKGLVIIKKKTPREENIIENNFDDNQEKKPTRSLSDIFGPDDSKKQELRQRPASEIFSQKAKKEKKKTPIKAHEHGKKIEVIKADDEFRSSDDSLLGEEIVLLDMDLQDNFKIFDEPKPINTANHSRSSKPAAFGNVPTGLQRGKRKKRIVRTQEKAEITSVAIPEDIRVYEFAEACGKTPADVIKVLFSLGMMVTKNDFLKQDELEILGEEFGIEVTVKDALEDVNYEESYDEEIDTKSFVTRPDRKSTRLNSSHSRASRMPSSA